jgi:hypothetical protein
LDLTKEKRSKVLSTCLTSSREPQAEGARGDIMRANGDHVEVVRLRLPLLLALLGAASATPNGHACLPGHNSSALPFCDHTLPIPHRVADLLKRLTVEEKAHLIAIRGDTPDGGAPRLGIPPYNWGIEILHGAAIDCIGEHCPTVLPVLACAASSFNRSAWRGMGAVISTEMRAANNNNGMVRPGEVAPHNPHVGLNGWGPNVNLARDPRSVTCYCTLPLPLPCCFLAAPVRPRRCCALPAVPSLPSPAVCPSCPCFSAALLQVGARAGGPYGGPDAGGEAGGRDDPRDPGRR